MTQKMVKAICDQNTANLPYGHVGNRGVDQVAAVRAELQKAMTTLRLLPLTAQDRPKLPTSAWGDFKQIASLSTGRLRRLIRRKATPEDISNMDYWLNILALLPESQRRIIVARACGIAWRRLEEIDGRSHTTLRKIEKSGLENIIQNVLRGAGGTL